MGDWLAVSYDKIINLGTAPRLDDMERRSFEGALHFHRRNRDYAARLLGAYTLYGDRPFDARQLYDSTFEQLGIANPLNSD